MSPCNGVQAIRVVAWAVLVSMFSGCSSLGLTLWPSQFPLLKTTKEIAAASPVPSGLAHELDKQVLEDYFLEPGDRILLEPISLEFDFAASGDQEVQVDGSVDLGEYGRLRVAGLTVESVEQLIEARIEERTDSDEHINVRLLESNASQVYILGQVGSPGVYPLLGREHVLDAILEAGGLTSEASPCDIILVRPTRGNQCRVVLPVCYRQITQIGDVTTNYQLQPGDRIVVGTRTLCEELAVWKQTESCERCCRSCGSEQDPQRVHYGNRLLRALTATPFLWSRSKAVEADSDSDIDSSVPDDGSSKSGLAPEAGTIDAKLLPAEDLKFDDSDLYLPALPEATLPTADPPAPPQ